MHFIKKYWVGICSVLAIGVSGFFLYSNIVGFYTNPSEGIVETSGKSTAYAFMAFFAASTLRKRWGKKKLEFLIFCFAVSFSLCSIYDSLTAIKQISQLNNAKQELARLANNLESVPSQKFENEYSIEKYGDFNKIIPLLQNSYAFSEKMDAEIDAAISELENILLPATLCDKDNIYQAKKRVASFSTKLSLLEQEYENEFLVMQEKIKKTVFANENLKKHALIGFEKGKKTTSSLMKEYFNTQKEGAKKIEDILNFLSTKLGTYSESEGLLIFENYEDVDTFNQLAQSLTDHIQKEDLINKKLETHRQSLLQKMKNYDKN